MSRPGTLIIVDNVVRSGELANAETTERARHAAGRRLLANHPRLDATVIQTVGAKGYDGFAIAIVSIRIRVRGPGRRIGGHG